MNWASASDFFAMGGYGLYVWGAYGVTAAAMLIDPLSAARRHRRALREADDDVQVPLEAGAADVAEQAAEAGPPEPSAPARVPLEADPADAVEQAAVVELDEDEHR